MKKENLIIGLTLLITFQLSAQKIDSTDEVNHRIGFGLTYLDHFGIGVCGLYFLDKKKIVALDASFGIPEPMDDMSWKFNTSLLMFSSPGKKLCIGIGYQFRKYISNSSSSDWVQITKTSSLIGHIGYGMQFGRIFILPKIGVGHFIDRYSYDKNIDSSSDKPNITFSNDEIDADLSVRFNYIF